MSGCKGLRVLVFSREAGGAAVLAPVVELLRARGARVTLIAGGNALKVFLARGLHPDIYEAYSPINGRFDALLTSAASLPQRDMTERRLWLWARARGIPSAAVVDQWQNYALRFSGASRKERLAYLPDRIFLMDETARRDAVKEGLPSARLVVTGQPALEDTVKQGRALARADARSKLGAKDGERLVVFASEPLQRYFPDLGYDEHTTLDFLMKELASCPKKVRLVVKPHPANDADAFRAQAARSPVPTTIAAGATPLEAIRGADLVVGMSSVLLLQSLLLKTPTLSLQLSSRLSSQLIATRSGALEFLTDEKKARAALRAALASPRARLARQALWKPPVAGAARRIVEALARIAVK